MGFPSLITTLCESQGIEVNRSEKIRPPITKAYIMHNCKEETGGRQQNQPQAQPQSQTPPHSSQQQPAQPQPPQNSPLQQNQTLDQQLANIRLHLEHVELQNDVIRQRQEHIHQGLFTAYQWQQPGNQYWLNPQEFTDRYLWPGVRPFYPEGEGAAAGYGTGAGAGPAGAASGNGADQNEDMEQGDDEGLLHEMETEEHYHFFGDL